MPPPVIPIITPSQDASNSKHDIIISLFINFLTCKMLKDCNSTINLPETMQSNYSRSSVEPSHTINSRESIIPRIPDMPAQNKTESVKELQPVVPYVKQKNVSLEEAEHQTQNNLLLQMYQKKQNKI
jgi:hypothetical protein